MVDKISGRLLRKYMNRTLCPVIIETKEGRFDCVRKLLKSILPLDLLNTKVHSIIGRSFEPPFSKWKEIRMFNMIACVLTPDLIEEVAGWKCVERLYYDDVRWAIGALPQEGVFLDWRKKKCTTTFWIKRMIGLDRANSIGYNGRGVIVSVLDTGVRPIHPQLIGRLATRPLTSMPEKGGSGNDENGHGTWVATAIGGHYRVDPRYKVPVEGMAPGCSLISIQVLGLIIGVGSSSDIIKGMEMSVVLGSKIVNMSLGGPAERDEENPESKAINKMVEAGIIPVVAAGNSGPDEGTIDSPGSCLNSLTVGAYDEFEGKVAEFSSRGPTKDGYIKPDVVAPGVNIDSGIVGYIDALVDPTQSRYGAISGTSMATPIVSGLLACASQLYREKLGKELTVHEVKRMMEELGHEKDNEEGWGLITWDLVEEWISTEYGERTH